MKLITLYDVYYREDFWKKCRVLLKGYTLYSDPLLLCFSLCSLVEGI